MAQSPRQRQARNKRRVWWKGRQCAAPGGCGAKARTSCAGWISIEGGKECRRPICLRHAVVISPSIDLCPFCQTGSKKAVRREWMQIQESLPFEPLKGGDRAALQIEATPAPSSKRRRNPKTSI